VIHLDTSFLILALATGTAEDRRLRAWIGNDESIGISTIAWTEFLCGPVSEVQVGLVAQIVGPPLAYEDEHAALAARLFNDAGRRRGSLMDCMIAAVAMAAEAKLATSNAEDFTRLTKHGLRLISNED
jgi:predicted nucleic acid-binding protein